MPLVDSPFLFCQEALDGNLKIISNILDINRITKSAGFHDLRFTLMIRDINHFIKVQDEMVLLPNVTKIESSITKMLCPWPMKKSLFQHFSTSICTNFKLFIIHGITAAFFFFYKWSINSSKSLFVGKWRNSPLTAKLVWIMVFIKSQGCLR